MAMYRNLVNKAKGVRFTPSLKIRVTAFFTILLPIATARCAACSILSSINSARRLDSKDFAIWSRISSPLKVWILDWKLRKSQRTNNRCRPLNRDLRNAKKSVTRETCTTVRKKKVTNNTI